MTLIFNLKSVHASVTVSRKSYYMYPKDLLPIVRFRNIKTMVKKSPTIPFELYLFNTFK